LLKGRCGKGKDKSEIQGSLPYAADDETVRRFGQDDVCFQSSLRTMIFFRIFSEFLNSF
jgi:hypothetical protein